MDEFPSLFVQNCTPYLPDFSLQYNLIKTKVYRLLRCEAARENVKKQYQEVTLIRPIPPRGSSCYLSAHGTRLLD
jgi:hypothetical protein